jgi:hypothetical protein
MVRHFRWVVAGLATAAVVCSSPARSRADIQILVEELNASNAVVANSTTFTVGTPTKSNIFTTFSYSSPDGSFSLSGSVGTNSPSGASNASLSTSFTGGFGPNFDPTKGESLRIVVTDDAYTGTGLPTALTNTAGASQGFAGGTITVSSSGSVYNPLDPTAVPASSTTAVAGGPTLGGPTGTASDSLPAFGSSNQVTQSDISSLPGTYAIQQVIDISFVQTGSIDTTSTFAGSAGARIDPVPAPGGLALALIGLPLLGLKRAIRKRAAAL